MSSKGTKEEYIEATRDLAKEVEEGVSDVPINKQTGRPHKGYENLRPFKKGENFHGGQKKGYKTPKTRLKEHLKMIKLIENDPELTALVESLNTTDMFEALKKTAFAMFASNPTDKDLFDRAYKAVAEDREYTEGKKTRQEVDTRITKVSDMTIEQLETELRDLDDIEEVEPQE
jgi:ribosomal protein L12E/L44/L45/RPP1/RPP2